MCSFFRHLEARTKKEKSHFVKYRFFFVTLVIDDYYYYYYLLIRSLRSPTEWLIWFELVFAWL